MATATQTIRVGRATTVPVKVHSNVFQEMWEHRADYVYVAPAIGVMALVILYPLIMMFVLSVQYTSPYGGKVSFVGLDNFKDAISDEHFGLIVVNTLVWTAASTIFALVIGMVAALAISRPMRFRGFIRGILITPWIISAVTAAFIWKWMYNADSGVISGILIQLHLIKQPIKFIDSPNLVLGSIIVANVWKSFPFAMIMILAGLQAIPEQLYNAAKIDGAGRWSRFREITLPQLTPVLTVTSILLVFGNMNAFTFIQVLTGGGPTYHSAIFAVQVYAQAFVGSPHFELAAALGVILFIILMAFAAVYLWILARQSRVRPVLLETEEGLALGSEAPGSAQ